MCTMSLPFSVGFLTCFTCSTISFVILVFKLLFFVVNICQNLVISVLCFGFDFLYLLPTLSNPCEKVSKTLAPCSPPATLPHQFGAVLASPGAGTAATTVQRVTEQGRNTALVHASEHAALGRTEKVYGMFWRLSSSPIEFKTDRVCTTSHRSKGRFRYGARRKKNKNCFYTWRSICNENLWETALRTIFITINTTTTTILLCFTLLLTSIMGHFTAYKW